MMVTSGRSAFSLWPRSDPRFVWVGAVAAWWGQRAAKRPPNSRGARAEVGPGQTQYRDSRSLNAPTPRGYALQSQLRSAFAWLNEAWMRRPLFTGEKNQILTSFDLFGAQSQGGKQYNKCRNTNNDKYKTQNLRAPDPTVRDARPHSIANPYTFSES